MKPPLRTKSVGTKVSEAEFALLEERACGAGMRLAEWVREALLSAPVESGVDSGEVALGEVLALRSLLLNLHLRAAKGEAIPEPEIAGLPSGRTTRIWSGSLRLRHATDWQYLGQDLNPS